MRTISKYILMGMIVLITSCGKDFVELKNPNQITSAYFWANQQDALLGTNACYQALTLDGTYMRKYQWTMDVRADDSYNMTPYTYVMSNLTNYTIGGEELDQPWECNYVGIWRANQVLSNIDGITMNEELKNRYKGEAKFIRGLCYFNLLNLFHNVVLYTHAPESVNDYYTPQSAPEVVWDQVYSDFTDAIAGCWNQNESRTIDGVEINNEAGRATKGAAAAFLARSYLMNKRFSDATPVLKDIVDGTYGTYSLVDNYSDNFTEVNENNTESLFEIQFQMGIGTTQGWVGDPQADWQRQDGYVKSLAPISVGWGDIAPSPWIVSEFQLEKDINGKNDIRMEQSMFFPHPDSAGYLIWGLPQDTVNSMVFATTGRTDLGIGDDYHYYVRKWADLPAQQITAWLSGVNRRLVRYADVLLLYAECLNETGHTAEAASFVQMVRSRAKLPDRTAEFAGYSQQQFREQIYHERALELCFETWRYIDLLRWGWFESQDIVTSRLTPHDPEFLNWIPGREYLAIPPSEVDRTNGIVIQNPAWN